MNASRNPAFVLSPLAVLVLLLPSSNARAYYIEIADKLSGGDFYKTRTIGEGFYTRYTGDPLKVAVPPNPDLDRSPTLLSDDRQPLRQAPSDIGRIEKLFALSAREGSNTTEGGDKVNTYGTAQQTFNIGGTFKVIAEANERTDGFINLLAKGLVDGFTRANPTSRADASASYSASIFIEHLGTVTATSITNPTRTETVGASAELSKNPNVSGKIETSVQKNTAGTAPQNFFMLGKVPIGQVVNWNFTMILQAMNESSLLLPSSATSWAIQQFVNLTPQGERLSVKKEDPLLSETRLRFDAATGKLSFLHPNATLAPVEFAESLDEDGDPIPTSPVSFASFLPEVEAVLDANGEFSDTDGLLHSLLAYEDLIYSGLDTDGSFIFADGRVDFLDPTDRSRRRASARLTNVKADPARNRFTASIADFELLELSPGASPLAETLAREGGLLWLDPSIMQLTGGFVQSATTSPYTVFGGPVAPIPLPASGLLWLSAGALLAGRMRRR